MGFGTVRPSRPANRPQSVHNFRVARLSSSTFRLRRLWALADDLVAKRIDAGDKRLTSVEWKSGSQMRIIDVVAPFGGEAEMRGQVGCT